MVVKDTATAITISYCAVPRLYGMLINFNDAGHVSLVCAGGRAVSTAQLLHVTKVVGHRVTLAIAVTHSTGDVVNHVCVCEVVAVARLQVSAAAPILTLATTRQAAWFVRWKVSQVGLFAEREDLPPQSVPSNRHALDHDGVAVAIGAFHPLGVVSTGVYFGAIANCEVR